ncbi:hypothetical protein HK104_005225, partial [Borealophlyctis nickersoniae]
KKYARADVSRIVARMWAAEPEAVKQMWVKRSVEGKEGWRRWREEELSRREVENGEEVVNEEEQVEEMGRDDPPSSPMAWSPPPVSPPREDDDFPSFLESMNGGVPSTTTTATLTDTLGLRPRHDFRYFLTPEDFGRAGAGSSPFVAEDDPEEF